MLHAQLPRRRGVRRRDARARGLFERRRRSVGPSTALKPIRLQLQWFPQAQFAGYFAALDKGYYKDEGFDVTILPGAVEIVPATVVAGGQAEFGISWVPRMLAPRESGADGVVIGQIFQRSPHAPGLASRTRTSRSPRT